MRAPDAVSDIITEEVLEEHEKRVAAVEEEKRKKVEAQKKEQEEELKKKNVEVEQGESYGTSSKGLSTQDYASLWDRLASAVIDSAILVILLLATEFLLPFKLHLLSFFARNHVTCVNCL